jgi:hypothetical protein
MAAVVIFLVLVFSRTCGKGCGVYRQLRQRSNLINEYVKVWSASVLARTHRVSNDHKNLETPSSEKPRCTECQFSPLINRRTYI